MNSRERDPLEQQCERSAANARGTGDRANCFGKAERRSRAGDVPRLVNGYWSCGGRVRQVEPKT